MKYGITFLAYDNKINYVQIDIKSKNFSKDIAEKIIYTCYQICVKKFVKIEKINDIFHNLL